MLTCTALAQKNRISQQSAEMAATSEVQEDERRSMLAFRTLNKGQTCGVSVSDESWILSEIPQIDVQPGTLEAAWARIARQRWLGSTSCEHP